MQALSRRRVAEYAAEQLVNATPLKPLAAQLAAYLVERRQTKQADQLLGDIAAVLAEKHGVVLAEVVSASKLSEALRQSITATIKQVQAAKSVIITESVDAGLLGGVTITTPLGHLDGSVRKKLRQLRAMNKEI